MNPQFQGINPNDVSKVASPTIKNGIGQSGSNKTIMDFKVGPIGMDLKPYNPNQGINKVPEIKSDVLLEAPNIGGSGILPDPIKDAAKKAKAVKTLNGVGVGLGMASDVARSGLDLLGVKKADGNEASSSIINGIGDIAMNFDPIIGGSIKLLNTVNDYAGPTVKGSGPDNYANSAYGDVGVDSNKFTLTQSLFGNSVADHKKKVSESQRQIGLKQGLFKDQEKTNLRISEDANKKMLANTLNKTGGFNTSTILGKSGLKLSLKNIKDKVNRKININKKELLIPELELEEITLFADGGKFNVIPEGALHARKHNLPEEIAEQVTNKGIPVITFDEGGEITQHAEIENSEIIFHKEITDKLEDL